jgi:uncharacterized membrane protein YidH (DUF202 family)
VHYLGKEEKCSHFLFDDLHPKSPMPIISYQNSGNVGGNFWTNIFNKKKQVARDFKIRKAPIKVEPKVFFSNERTFLAWLHVSVILAGGSIAILAFAEDQNPGVSQIYGILLLPVAVVFIVYAMVQCKWLEQLVYTMGMYLGSGMLTFHFSWSLQIQGEHTCSETSTLDPTKILWDPLFLESF